MKTPVFALSISAQAVLNLHSLNNEGSEGNQTQTRMVNILTRNGDGEYVTSNVNAISGDMFKHMQASHLHRIASQRGLPLCEACQRFDANRISADENFREWLKAKNPTQVQVIDYMIDACVIDDLMGNLITEGSLSTPRKSTAEYGWIVALPDHVSTDEYFHVKYVPDQREKPEDKDQREGNLGQAIFHRPASSGAYAMVCHLEPARIGYNDVIQTYVDVNREERYRAMLESLLNTFLEPGGAMRNTQLPHIVEVWGAVTLSHGVVPAPALSPLDPFFVDNLTGIANELNQLHPAGTVEVRPFDNLTGLAAIMRELIADTTPYQLVYRQA